MIKRLKKRFIAAVLICVFCETLILGAGINILSQIQRRSSISSSIEAIASEKVNIGFAHPNADGSKEKRIKDQFATALVDASGNILKIDVANILSLSDSEISALVNSTFSESVADAGKIKRIGTYYYTFAEKTDGYLFVVIDAQHEIDAGINLLLVTFAIIFICMAITALLACIFAPKAIKPVIERDIKQAQFLTDASHELKTPIAIIQANIEALEITSGPNKWTENIKFQSERLIKLVRSMSFLSKLNEANHKVIYSDVDLSQIVEMATDEFEEMAVQGKKSFLKSIQPGVFVNGSAEELTELLHILTDNAIKYSLPDSKITISLTEENRKAYFSISNKCEHIDEDKLPKLFERFYRPGSSRTQNEGGSGIGLSMAKSIVASLGGKISVSQNEDTIKFFVCLKAK